MKQILKTYFQILAIIILLSACAKQSTPTGGPRDEDPPIVLEMLPKDQSLNTKPEKIVLTFDEFIKLDNPNKNIIITPRINKDEIEILALKNTVTIELNQELEENTTYVFNFQKSIQDLSEANPAENLKLVFSTGNTIDSIQFSGKVNFYFPAAKEEYKDILIGLYPVGDTTDLFTSQPYYLSQVDTSGNFTIQNIKNGTYRAYAWKDNNNSLKAEFKSEAYDFFTDTLDLNQNVEGGIFNLSVADLTPIRLLRSASSGKNYDIILNKDPIEINLENEEIGKSLFYTYQDKRIKIYPTEAKTDSLPLKIVLQDSIGSKIDTLLWAKFPDSDRRPETLTLTANSGKSFIDTLKAELSFNKPILKINTDSLYIKIDSANSIRITKEMMRYRDSLRRDKLLLNIPVEDSIAMEIFTITAADSTFMDIEDQYNEKALTANYRRLKKETLADLLAGIIQEAQAPFIIQLLDQKAEIRAEKYVNENRFKFERLEAGTYRIRIIEDSNSNLRWDPSNFTENRLAERVFYYVNPESTSKDIVIRGGWSLEDLLIIPTKKTGIHQK
ncbi:Ig-like domain-containing domain [Algoriphagus sp. CAU 1675]|uniref:Ig-like domain-containing domain n=1 Tax=Algoriphagus sp. CAU 1675 TaxID=3032597 RepID=UPI0023DA0D45|nr:Ig-like domain-containing domain [Algoriphagus sp. CAU 1675]MDF2156411.1 Ig-like domain-containing domain [Algoriphagus sp. CAU 1675]